MAKNTETELKYSLTQTEYRKLLRFSQGRRSKVQRQTNVYFDTPKGALKRLKYSLRVRLINRSRAELTLKYPKTSRSTVKALKVRGEQECSLPFKMAQALCRGTKRFERTLKPPLGRLPVNLDWGSLSPIGSVRTRRKLFRWEGLELTLDAFLIKGRKFWEFEVETTQPAKADQKIRELFQLKTIRYRPGGPSKFSRMKKAYRIP